MSLDRAGPTATAGGHSAPRTERRGRPEERIGEIGERALASLGRQGMFDRPSYRFEHVVGLVMAACGGAGERIGNVLQGTWLGHPLHPLVTTLPMGAAATTLALDAVDIMPGHRDELRRAARFSLGVGIVGNLAAAVTGVTDWQHTQEQSRRVGLVHGALNAAATWLYALSWWDRRRDRQARAVAASALGYGITLASGYLGGSLVYRSGTGVDQSGPRLSTRRWTAALSEDQLEDGAPRRVEVAGVGVVLFRDGEAIIAVGERCPHLGAPMADGWIDRGRLVCPWHGSQFERTTGKPLRGPATAPLPCYQARVREGAIEVRDVAPTALPAAVGIGG